MLNRGIAGMTAALGAFAAQKFGGGGGGNAPSSRHSNADREAVMTTRHPRMTSRAARPAAVLLRRLPALPLLLAALALLAVIFVQQSFPAQAQSGNADKAVLGTPSWGCGGEGQPTCVEAMKSPDPNDPIALDAGEENTFLGGLFTVVRLTVGSNGDLILGVKDRPSPSSYPDFENFVRLHLCIHSGTDVGDSSIPTLKECNKRQSAILHQRKADEVTGDQYAAAEVTPDLYRVFDLRDATRFSCEIYSCSTTNTNFYYIWHQSGLDWSRGDQPLHKFRHVGLIYEAQLWFGRSSRGSHYKAVMSEEPPFEYDRRNYPDLDPTVRRVPVQFVKFSGADIDMDVHLSVNPASSATAGEDFELLTPKVTIPSGETEAYMSIRIIDDDLAEPPERIIFDVRTDPEKVRISSNVRTIPRALQIPGFTIDILDNDGVGGL